MAWQKVKANQGASGIDRQTIEEYEANLSSHLENLHEELKQDTYRPLPVRRVWIAKDATRKRPLGIPAVRDRVVQQAVVNILKPHWEPLFHERSYGFRPGRSTRDALATAWREIRNGREWVVDLDVQSYFDTIPHEALLDMVAEEVSDGRVLKLIRSFLKAGVVEKGNWFPVQEGTPQGGVISPLLANIYLHRFDVAMAEAGISAVRYADDSVLLCRSCQEAIRALTCAKQVLEGELGLTVHPTKTKVIHITEGFDFLGYHIRRGWKSLYAIPREKSLQRFKKRVREITRRNRPVKLVQVIQELNEVIGGWGNYYRKAQVRGLFWRLDIWIRLRVYSFISKRWQTRTWRKCPGQLLYGPLGLQRLFTLIPCKS